MANRNQRARIAQETLEILPRFASLLTSSGSVPRASSRMADGEHLGSTMESVAIILLCITSAIAYGIVHDQITARICVEYFTVGHPRIIPTDSPTVLGIVWGIIATWWVGLGLGVPLAIAARAGRRSKRNARSLVRPILILLLVMAVFALVAGVTGFLLGRSGAVFLVEPMASQVPPEKHARFLADLWAHSASYLVGFVGGLVVIGRVWRSRRVVQPAGV